MTPTVGRMTVYGGAFDNFFMKVGIILLSTYVDPRFKWDRGPLGGGSYQTLTILILLSFVLLAVLQRWKSSGFWFGVVVAVFPAAAAAAAVRRGDARQQGYVVYPVELRSR